MPLAIVTDNGSAFKSIAFDACIRARPYLRHVAPATTPQDQRRRRALLPDPGTSACNPRAIWDVVELRDAVAGFVAIYNGIRSNESLGFAMPLSAYFGA